MPQAVDVHLGRRIRQARWMKSMNQADLAGRLGIPVQQIQKYERGSARISASRLWDVATTLDVDVSFFYRGMTAGAADDHHDVPVEVLTDKEALAMVRAYYRIPESQRRHLFDLATVLTGTA
jgi:transcriptional regulator with XRE-family HTH domain